MRAVFHLLATLVKVVDPEDIRICTDTPAVSSEHTLRSTAEVQHRRAALTSFRNHSTGCCQGIKRGSWTAGQLGSWPAEELQHSEISHPDCISEGDGGCCSTAGSRSQGRHVGTKGPPGARGSRSS